MILFDLKCASGSHVFEAWFASSHSYDDQKARGLVTCPLCGDADVAKAVMAPNVSSKGNQRASSSPSEMVMNDGAEPPAAASEVKTILARVAELQAESLKKSKWVGKDFETKARAMDAGDIAHSPIHGQATPDQAKSMIEDGIGVMPLLVPIVPPDQQN